MAAIMTQSHGDVIVAYFTEARLLDDSLMDQVGRELMSIVDRVENGKLLLNFQGVRFMASSMLGKIIRLNKHCKEAGVSLKLSNICPEIKKVFTLMKLHKVLDIYDDESRALSAFEKKRWFG